MSVLRERLHQEGYFNYDDQASKVLEEYAQGFPPEVRNKTSQLIETAAAEIAIFRFLEPDLPSLPLNLRNANVPITMGIGILATRFYYCPMFDPPWCGSATLDALSPEMFRVEDIPVFNSDVFRIRALCGDSPFSDLVDINSFLENIVKPSLAAESTWPSWAIDHGAHPTNSVIVPKAQLALWAARIAVIAEAPIDTIMENFQLVLERNTGYTQIIWPPASYSYFPRSN